MELITLVCWTCGATKSGEVAHLPQFGYEFAHMAQQAGWIGVLDFERSRALVFCSEACDDAAKTKSGQYRIRPKTVKREVA